MPTGAAADGLSASCEGPSTFDGVDGDWSGESWINSKSSSSASVASR